MTRIRKLIWALWFTGSGLVLLSWLRLVNTDVGWTGTYIAAAGWLVSLATSRQPQISRDDSTESIESSGLDRETADEYRAAIVELTRRLERLPENRSELLASRGAYYRALGKWESAISDLDSAIATSPHADGVTLFDRAIALYESGDAERALADIQNAIEQFETCEDEPDDLESAHLWMHDILLKLERFEAVIADCNRLLPTQTANEARIRIARACALTAIGKHDDSLNELNTVMTQLDNDHVNRAQALRARAGVRLRMGEVARAIVDIEQLQTDEGPTEDNLSLMGLAQIQSNDFHEALNCYKKAALLATPSADTYSQIALIQAGCPEEKSRDGTQAEVNARKACELTKWNDWTHISILAAAKAELGDFAEAIELAEWAFRLAPDQEKNERQERIEQYRNGEPFRIGDALPRTILRRNPAGS